MKTLLWKRLKQQVMLLTIVLLLSNVQLYAQTWFPLGSEWTYSTYIPAEERSVVTSIYAVRDTIIQGKKAVILNGSSDCSACKTDNIFYYDSSLNIVYQYLGGSFKPYFDFSKQAGESYTMYFCPISNQNGYDSVFINIDSIVNHQISGINVRFQYVSISGNAHYSFTGPIIEFIGSKEGFYPEDEACDFSVFRGLRCYSDSVLTYYSDSIFQAKGCDFDVSISEANFSKMKLYPNPAQYILTIEIQDADILFPCKLMIIDILGKELKRYSVNDSKTTLNISNLSPGVYVLKASTQEGIHIKKFVKK